MVYGMWCGFVEGLLKGQGPTFVEGFVESLPGSALWADWKQPLWYRIHTRGDAAALWLMEEDTARHTHEGANQRS